MATAAQIREKAAEILGILGEGETLPSYETDDLDDAYSEVYQELQAHGLTTWSQTGKIPDRLARHIAILVAANRVIDYKVPVERYQQIRGERDVSLAEIRQQQAKNKTVRTQMDNY